MPEISRSQYPEFYSASFLHSSFFSLSSRTGRVKHLRAQIVEISVECQKFPTPRIRNKIPSIYYIHHLPLIFLLPPPLSNYGIIRGGQRILKGGGDIKKIPYAGLEISALWQKFLEFSLPTF